MESVVVLHGIARTSRSMGRLARYLERQGFRVLNVNYRSTRVPLEILAEDIHPEIAAFAAGAGRVHFVGYSMGGLLTRVYLAAHPLPNLGRIVMIGTPNHGSEIADAIKDWRLFRFFFGPAGQQLGTRTRRAEMLPVCEFGIIAGNRSIDFIFGHHIAAPHDGKVSVESTKLEGMADHIVLPAVHTFMPEMPSIWQQVVAFLRDGKFARD